MSFAKNIDNKYVKKLFDTAKKSTTASKRAIQKTAEAKGGLIGNKIADKITSISKKSVKELPINDGDVEITTHKQNTYRQKKDN